MGEGGREGGGEGGREGGREGERARGGGAGHLSAPHLPLDVVVSVAVERAAGGRRMRQCAAFFPRFLPASCSPSPPRAHSHARTDMNPDTDTRTHACARSRPPARPPARTRPPTYARNDNAKRAGRAARGGGGGGDALFELHLDAVQRHGDEHEGGGDVVARLAAVGRERRAALLIAEVGPVRREEDRRGVDEGEAEEPQADRRLRVADGADGLEAAQHVLQARRHAAHAGLAAL